MLIQPMKTAIRPITEQASIGILSTASSSNTYGSCGRQFSVFAKSILDKYTKVLNYQFDYSSLVFLEQMANGEVGTKREEYNTIIVTWKLLSFLLNQETKQNQFLYQNPSFMQQMLEKVEQNLVEIRRIDKNIYQEMRNCYKIYQKETMGAYSLKIEDKNEKEQLILDKEKDGKLSRSAAIVYVEQQIKKCEEKQKSGVLIKKENEKTNQFFSPVIMSRSFFMNLHHFTNENKTVSYKQIWQQAVSRQLEKYYLDLHMQKFVKEQDFFKKEEKVLQMLQEYGSEKIQTYLENASETLYEQFLSVLYTMAGQEKDIWEQNTNSIIEKEQTNGELSETKQVLESYSMKERTEKEQIGTIEKVENIHTQEYDSSQRTLLLAEYKNTENSIMDILKYSEEITRNIVLSKVEEYKELFYEYIRSSGINQDVREQEIESNREVFLEKQGLIQQAEGEEISPNKQYRATTVEQELDNLEIFTDEELHILLNTIDKKNVTEEALFLKKKLNLLAIKEITESFLKEDTQLLQKDRLEQISYLLEQISFVSQDIDKKEIREQTSKEILEHTEVQRERKELISMKSTGKIKEKTEKIISEKLQKQWKWKSEEKLQNIVVSMQKKPRTIVGVSGIERKLKETEKENPKKEERFSYNMKQIWETGTLLERKLVYLALENNIDSLIMEKHAQPKKEKELKELIEAKQKIIKETDAQKKVSGDWRFLMKKQRRQEILETILHLQEETKEQLERLVQQNMKEFYSYIAEKEEIQQILLKHKREASEQTAIRRTGELKVTAEEKKQELFSYDMKQIWETGTLLERKLVYLALENNMDSLIMERHNQPEKEKELKELIEAKQKIIKESDAQKKVSGDWRFLMKKQRRQEILETILHLQEETKEQLENLVQQNMREFYSSVVEKKEREAVREEKKSLLEVEQGNGKKEAVGAEKQIFLQSMETVLEKEEIQQLLLREKKEHFKEIEKKKVLLKEHLEEGEQIQKQKKVYRQIKKIQMSDMVHILENGTLPERKLMYLVLKNAISTMSERKIDDTDMKNSAITQAQILQYKEEFFTDIDKMQITEENWKLIWDEKRSKRMMELFATVSKTDREWFKKHIREQVKEYYKVLSVFDRERKTQEEEIRKQKERKEEKERTEQNKIIQHNRSKEIWNDWSLVFGKEERKHLLHSKEIIKTHELWKRNIKKENVFTKTSSLVEITKKVNKKLKNRQLYGKILQRVNATQGAKIESFNNRNEVAKPYSHVELQFGIEVAEKQQLHQIVGQLKKEKYFSSNADSIQMDLLTQRNIDFTQPPVEEVNFSRKDKKESMSVTEQIKHHEESVKLILSHAKEKKVTEEKEQKRSKVTEQEKILRELEGSLLDYKAELEEKSERLEIVEKQIQSQTKELNLLKENQIAVEQKNIKPTQVRQVMKHWKEEMKLEQMRRGKY